MEGLLGQQDSCERRERQLAPGAACAARERSRCGAFDVNFALSTFVVPLLPDGRASNEVVYTYGSDQLDLVKSFTAFRDKYIVRMSIKVGVRVPEQVRLSARPGLMDSGAPPGNLGDQAYQRHCPQPLCHAVGPTKIYIYLRSGDSIEDAEGHFGCQDRTTPLGNVLGSCVR
jgi:hypothetical protein